MMLPFVAAMVMCAVLHAGDGPHHLSFDAGDCQHRLSHAGGVQCHHSPPVGHAVPLGSCPCLSVPFSPPVPASASCPGDAPGDGSVCPCLVSLPQSVSLCLPCTATTTILTPVSDDGNCPCLFVPIANTSNTTSFDATRTTNATLTTTTIRNAFRHVHMLSLIHI